MSPNIFARPQPRREPRWGVTTGCPEGPSSLEPLRTDAGTAQPELVIASLSPRPVPPNLGIFTVQGDSVYEITPLVEVARGR